MHITGTVTVYGIPNCDQVKKARSWLTGHGVDVQFHDFKKAGVTAELIRSWLTRLDCSTILNRRGTTWRALPADEQALVVDDASAIACMIKSPSTIKRPILVIRNPDNHQITGILAGFSESSYQQLLDQHQRA